MFELLLLLLGFPFNLLLFFLAAFFSDQPSWHKSFVSLGRDGTLPRWFENAMYRTTTQLYVMFLLYVFRYLSQRNPTTIHHIVVRVTYRECRVLLQKLFYCVNNLRMVVNKTWSTDTSQSDFFLTLPFCSTFLLRIIHLILVTCEQPLQCAVN